MTQMPPAETGGAAMKPHRGTMILIFGILGIFCVIFAIIAWVMGNKDLEQIRAGTMDPAGEGTTKAGKILGMVFTILFVIGLVLQVILITIGAGAAAGGAAGGAATP